VFSEGKTSDNMAIREGDCHMFETQYDINTLRTGDADLRF